MYVKNFQILSPPHFVSFSGPQNRETKCGGLKQLEEIGDFLQFVSISFTLIKLKQNEETEDLWPKSVRTANVSA